MSSRVGNNIANILVNTTKAKQPYINQWIAKKSRNPNKVPASRAHAASNLLPILSNPDRKKNNPWRIKNLVSHPKSNLPTNFFVEILNSFEVLIGHKEQEHPIMKKERQNHSGTTPIHPSSLPTRKGGKSTSTANGDGSKQVTKALHQKNQIHAHRKINCNLWGSYHSVDAKYSWPSFPSGSLSSCPIIFSTASLDSQIRFFNLTKYSGINKNDFFS